MAKRNRFNVALVKQIEQHVVSLGLDENVVVKFTGDGWLLLTDDAEQVPALCCLATIMANRFQAEMSEKAGFAMARVPPLRLTICSGSDIRVSLFTGSIDWVGDSARRATRESKLCEPNETLIDYTVYSHVFRDFACTALDVCSRLPTGEREEELPLYVLGDIKSEVAEESETPDFFIYTLHTIRKETEAKEAAQLYIERVITQAEPLPPNMLLQMDTTANTLREVGLNQEAVKLDYVLNKQGFTRSLVSWNRRLASSRDYSSALEILQRLLDTELIPNVITYNTLISIAPDYDTAKAWLEKMVEDGIQPDVITYSTLISIALDYDTAKAWLEKMVEDGIQPNVITYSTLFSKDLSQQSAEDILNWYLTREYHPEQPVQAAIAGYRKIGRIDQALRLALDYPHLDAARKLIREHEKEALSYFRSIANSDPQHPNADYALGVAFIEIGREGDARPHLQRALKLARAGARRTVIREWLRQMDRNYPKDSR